MTRLLLIAALAVGCGPATTQSVWRPPGSSVIALHGLVVIAPVKDPEARRSIEDQVARQLPSSSPVPSYRVLPDLSASREALSHALKTKGFDGAIVLRLARVDGDAASQPGAQQAFGAWSTIDPGELRGDTLVRVETSLWSLKRPEQLFAAVSRAAHPPDLRKLIDETVLAVRDELQKQRAPDPELPQYPISGAVDIGPKPRPTMGNSGPTVNMNREPPSNPRW